MLLPGIVALVGEVPVSPAEGAPGTSAPVLELTNPNPSLKAASAGNVCSRFVSRLNNKGASSLTPTFVTA
jgi:hypothetical protein